MKIYRAGFCALLAFCVLAYGGVEEWSQAVLEVGAGLLLVAWAFRQYRKKTEQVIVSPLLFPLIAFALVTLAQLVFHRTASSYHTRVELQLLTAYGVLLLVMLQSYYRPSHWRGFIWFLMGLSFFVSIFGILQHLTFNGKLYWFRVMRYGGYPFGPYVNRNHFAGFAELLIPVALVPLVLGKVRKERLFIVVLFAVVPIVALLLSASRGGIISFAVEMLVLMIILMMRRVRGRAVVLAGTVVLVAVLAVSWIGVRQVLQRFSGYQSVDISMGKRGSMSRDSWRIFMDHPVLGTGLGTLQLVFPPYDSLYDGKIVNHTHNDYLEALAETGALGGLCCFWFLCVLLAESWRGLRNAGNNFGSAVNLSGLVGCSGFLVHSLADFNLHIPANALLFLVMAHLATLQMPKAPNAPNARLEAEELTEMQIHGNAESRA
jgi:O-antigen ligase